VSVRLPVRARTAGFDSPALKSPVTITGSAGWVRAATRSAKSAADFSRDGCERWSKWVLKW
jgi:hypothetical protein